MSIDLSPNEDADANVVVTELNDWVKQSEMVREKVDELMAGNKLDAIFCVAGGWAGGNAKSKSEFFCCQGAPLANTALLLEISGVQWNIYIAL